MAKAEAFGLADLQRAVFNVLNAPPITTDLGCSVYDDVPQSAQPPLIRIVTTAGDSWDTFGRVGYSHLIDLHVFTDYQGSMHAMAILDACAAKLDGELLWVPNYSVRDIARQVHREGVDEIISGVKTSHRIAPFRVLMLAGEQP